MSIQALKWVFDDVDCPSAHATLVLFVYANYANEHGRAYPSTETVVGKTKQNVKTVRAAIDALEDAGLLIDTGKRVGRTGNVKVYALGMEGLPEVGALKGETACGAAGAPQEAQERAPAEARPKTGALKATVSGSKATRIREAEPVLEPLPLEDADASSAPQGAKDRCGTIDQDWQAPRIADLPAAIRTIAEQWPVGAYQAYAEAHRAYCAAIAGRSRRRRNPTLLWHARIVELGGRPMRDIAAGLKFDTAAGTIGAVMSPTEHADWCEQTAALYDRIGRREDAAELRAKAAEARSV